jgi:serine/threonine protein kinase
VPNVLSQEQWRNVLRLAEEVAELPDHEQRAFLESSQADPEIVCEVLTLVHEFNSAARPPHSTGLQVGRFVITGCLGRGGMGEVFSAQDTELDRMVALKFLAPGITLLPEAIQKFIREAQTASALNHPNIITIHEVIRSESGIAIVMELVEGEPLRHLCGTQLSISQILDIGRQIGRALAAAHARGIVHRDIKPENIILRPDGCVKVLDFGLARQALSTGFSFNSSMPAGTLRYMSPEQARSEPAASASDIFSFGLVLHELATGKHAFPGDSPLETAHAILTREPSGPLPADLPANLRRLILSMLSKWPEARPTAEDVVRQLDQTLAIESSSHGALWRKAVLGHQRFWLALVPASLVIGGVIAWFGMGKRGGQELSDLAVRPLTSQAGWENAPALSRDGESIAFTWSRRLDTPKQIYIKRETNTEPVQLTDSATGNIGYLAWSPDGKRIAFKRQFDKQGALYSISSSGGDEQKIVDLSNANLSSSIDWSPDGRQLAFSDSLPGAVDHFVIYLYNLQTGEKRKLTSPPANIWGDWNPKFSPDGRTIAFKRVTGFWVDDIYLVSSTGGPVRQITRARRGIWGHAWMPDGQSLLVSCQRYGTIFGIWRFPLKSPSSPERVAQGGVDAIAPATGRNTRRIAWVNQLWDLNIYRIPSTGNGNPVRLIASTQRDQDPVYSPDGRIGWISDRSGTREVWISREDGSNQVQVTNLNGPPIDHLRWSFDGRYLAFDSRSSGYPDIFVLECPPGGLNCSAAKALNVSPAESPGWSADSKSVYFSSDRTGQWQIWKQDLSGGKPVQVTRTVGSCPNESSDGKWLYYSDRRDNGTIFRVPGSQSGGSRAVATFVLGRPYKVQHEGWALTAREIVFIDRPTPDRPAAIRAYNLTTRKVRSILDLTEVFLDRGDIGVSVSADGKSILYAQLDRSGSNVIIADNNR